MADEGKFTQADIDKAVEKATGDVQGLKDKIEELIGDNKKLKQQARAASEIKPEDLQAAEDRAEKAEARATELEKSVKSLTGERDKAVKALETESSFTAKLLIQDGLKSELIKAGVKDEDYLDMAVAKFAPGASIKVEGDARTAMIGDKALADAIKEWAATDAGKKVIAAPANSGGGSGGSGGAGGSGKTATEAEFNAMSAKERSAFMSDGGTVSQSA